jgi:excisionase family DNA binding protein
VRSGRMAKVTLMVEAETDAYGPEETAKLLGKGEATIWRWLRDGKILAVKVGGRTLIPEKEIERLQKELGMPNPTKR